MAITFSFKEKKKITPEKYDFPVLTQFPYTGEKHSVAKFELNKAALRALQYPENLKDCKISVGMNDENGRIVLVNTTGQETPNQFNVNMDGTVNSKFLLGRLTKAFGHSPVENKEFVLAETGDIVPDPLVLEVYEMEEYRMEGDFVEQSYYYPEEQDDLSADEESDQNVFEEMGIKIERDNI